MCFDSENICFDSNRHVGGAKTIGQKQLVIDLLAVKLQLRVLLTKFSTVYLKVSPYCIQKIHCCIYIIGNFC